MRHLILLSLCFTPASLAAQANCPTAETLKKGAVVFTVDGEEEVHTRAPNGVVTITEAEDENGIVARTIVARGIHVLQLADLVNGKVDQATVWRFAFTDPIDQLPIPTPGGTWLGKTTVYHDGDSNEEDVAHTWGALQTVTIGSCSYDAIPVTADYRSDEYDHVEEMLYLPALDTAMLMSYRDADGTDVYNYTDIRAQ